MNKMLIALTTLCGTAVMVAAAPRGPDAAPASARGCIINVRFTYEPDGILPNDFAQQPVSFITGPGRVIRTRYYRGRHRRRVRAQRRQELTFSQVRIKTGTWARLSNDRSSTHAVAAGASFRRTFELRQGCNAQRLYRFVFSVATGEETREQVYEYPLQNGRNGSTAYTKNTTIDLGNVALLLR